MSRKQRKSRKGSWQKNRQEKRRRGPKNEREFLDGVLNTDPVLGTLQKRIDQTRAVAEHNITCIANGDMDNLHPIINEECPYGTTVVEVVYEPSLCGFVPVDIDNHPYLQYGSTKQGHFFALQPEDFERAALWGIHFSNTKNSVDTVPYEDRDHVKALLQSQMSAESTAALYEMNGQYMLRHIQVIDNGRKTWRRSPGKHVMEYHTEAPAPLTKEEQSAELTRRGYFVERLAFSVLMKVGPYLNPKIELHIGDARMDRNGIDATITVENDPFGIDVKHRYQYNVHDRDRKRMKLYNPGVVERLRQRFELAHAYPAIVAFTDIDGLERVWRSHREQGVIVTPDELLHRGELIEMVTALLVGVHTVEHGNIVRTFSLDTISHAVQAAYGTIPEAIEYAAVA